MQGYFVYKWVLDEEIVYIGKTVNPDSRFNQERLQEKFKPYLDADIYTTELKNRTEMDGLEKLLINKYQPRLNVVDRHEESGDIPIDDESLEWKNYGNILKINKQRCELERIREEYNTQKDWYRESLCYSKIAYALAGMLEGWIQKQTFDFFEIGDDDTDDFDDLKFEYQEETFEKFVMTTLKYCGVEREYSGIEDKYENTNLAYFMWSNHKGRFTISYESEDSQALCLHSHSYIFDECGDLWVEHAEIHKAEMLRLKDKMEQKEKDLEDNKLQYDKAS